MDFKEILDAWEKKQAGASSEQRQGMEELISRYPPKEPKEADRLPEGGESSEIKSKRRNYEQPDLRTLKPQATLDLHGMNSREAEQALENFVLDCRRRSIRKVLIIHGKGHHSQGDPVLKEVVRRYLEKSPYAGAFGPADRKHGGRGATWVVVRRA